MFYRNIARLLRDTVVAWIDDRAASMGAALAFYTLLSLAPLSIIVIAIAGVFFGQQAAQGEIVAQVEGLIGRQGAIAVQAIIESARDPVSGLGTVTAGILILLFTATSVFTELKNSLDHIWHVKTSVSPGQSVLDFLETQLLSFAMIAITGALLLVSIVVSTALTTMRYPVAGTPYIAESLHFALFFGMLTLLFATIYKILPDIRIAWKDVWIGAAITALLFSLGKSLIALYLATTPITSVFGAAGSIIAGLLWVYYSAQIFFFGAEFTKLYAYRYGSHQTSESRTASSAEARPE